MVILDDTRLEWCVCVCLLLRLDDDVNGGTARRQRVWRGRAAHTMRDCFHPLLSSLAPCRMWYSMMMVLGNARIPTGQASQWYIQSREHGSVYLRVVHSDNCHPTYSTNTISMKANDEKGISRVRACTRRVSPRHAQSAMYHQRDAGR
jgi:hypothetical protein